MAKDPEFDARFDMYLAQVCSDLMSSTILLRSNISRMSLDLRPDQLQSPTFVGLRSDALFCLPMACAIANSNYAIFITYVKDKIICNKNCYSNSPN